jgi:rhamnosyltransferase
MKISKIKIIGIVVLYHPPKRIEDNILSYIEGLDKLIIWKNSQCNLAFLSKHPDLRDKIVIMGDNINVGLGVSYNVAIRYAKDYGYTHLLTMDQDSCFINNDFKTYCSIVEQTAEKNFVLSPSYISDESMINRERLTNTSLFTDKDSNTIMGSMASGTVWPIVMFDIIGLFREDFFLYLTDTELFLRAFHSNIAVKQIESVYLLHECSLGNYENVVKWKIGKRIFVLHDYPPFTMYNMIRNHIVMKRHYPEISNWMLLELKWLFYTLVWGDCKWVKCKAWFYGLYHGCLGKTAVCPDFLKPR